MNIIFYIFRFLYRIRWWLILGPLIVALIVIWQTKNMSRTYETEMTVYTGIISNHSLSEDASQNQDWNVVVNTLKNLINLITSKETLANVSLHLYARCMIHGDVNKDNIYISAEHYQELLNITPKDVRVLIDKTSEERTVANLLQYEKPERNNFVYGLINWNHPYFSYNALKNIKVKQIEGSDILEISYANNDPGVVYQTLDVLNQIYVKEYKRLQYGTTNNTIKYFEAELARVGKELRQQEDSLTNYNVANRIINYDEQTKQVSTLDRDFSMKYRDVLLDYNSSTAAIEQLEEGMNENLKLIKSNSKFISMIDDISDLKYSITQMESFNADSVQTDFVGEQKNISNLRDQLTQKEKDFKSFILKISSQKFTKEGYPTSNFVTQWVDELLILKKSEAELKVMDDLKKDLDLQYSHFSPIGSTIKRKERSIHFTENTYLTILSSLNAARLRLKSLQMNSATLKVINPPTYPLDSKPTKRMLIILAAFLGSFIFILGAFLIIEFFDRTLRDRLRTKWITSGDVLGAFPKNFSIRNATSYTKAQEIAIRFLANQIYGFLNDSSSKFVNLVSIKEAPNTKLIAEKLQEYWQKLGVRVQILSYKEDFDASSRNFFFEKQLKEKIATINADIILVIHSPLKETPVPIEILESAALNLLMASSTDTWKEHYQSLYKNLVKQSGETPVYFCLTNAERYAVENFTGMLPPFTFYRKLIYHLVS